MKRSVGIVISSVLLIVAASSMSAEKNGSEIVVSATRMASDAELVASSVTVITGDMIRAKQSATLLDVLADVPGVHIARNGGLGSRAGLFLRGAKTEQTLVLIDGVEINDPIAAGRDAYLANIDLVNIERIEVLRGVQGGVYGSDAMGGVISIVTRKGEGDPKFLISTEGGSFNTFTESLGVSGASGSVDYSASITRIDSEGISSASEEDGNTEADGFKHTSVGVRVGVAVSDAVRLNMTGRYMDSESEFDASGGPGGDAEGNVAKRETLLLRSECVISLMDSAWEQILAVSFAQHDRSSDSDWGKSTFKSHLFSADWQNNITIGDANILSAGVEFDQEAGRTDSLSQQTVSTISGFLQHQFAFDSGLAGSEALRVDSHEEYGTEMTFRVGPTYAIDSIGLRFKATAGTGYKAPSIYQLYAPASAWGAIGNVDLEPEKSVGWDVGIDERLPVYGISFGATYFWTDFEDMIDFDSGYVNKSMATTKGIEFFGKAEPLKNLNVGVSYTYLDAEDTDSHESLTRRPGDRASVSFSYAFFNKANVSMRCLYVGERFDKSYNASMFTYEDVTLDDYVVVDLAASYEINEIVRVHGRVENLLNEQYEEIDGYGTPGISGYAGVSITL